jgi:hypothetical protein
MERGTIVLRSCSFLKCRSRTSIGPLRASTRRARINRPRVMGAWSATAAAVLRR